MKIIPHKGWVKVSSEELEKLLKTIKNKRVERYNGEWIYDLKRRWLIPVACSIDPGHPRCQNFVDPNYFNISHE